MWFVFLPKRRLIIRLLLPYVGLHLFVQAFQDNNGMRSITITILKNGLLNVPPVIKSSLSQSLTKPTVLARRKSRVCYASKNIRIRLWRRRFVPERRRNRDM